MFWPTLTHYGWAVSIRTAGQFVALQVDSFHHNGWRYWVRIRSEGMELLIWGVVTGKFKRFLA